jgi:hypothetical protein
MTKDELYYFVKGVILATPACPDGNGGPCASCMAEIVAEALIAKSVVETWTSTILDEV